MNKVHLLASRYRIILAGLIAAFVLAGCQKDDSTSALTASKQAVCNHDHGHEHEHKAEIDQHDEHEHEHEGHDHEDEVKNDQHDDHEHDHEAENEDAHAHEEAEVHQHQQHAEHESEETAHIAIPDAVRKNLGITFVKAELRPIQSTVRMPGQFELQPEARREYHTMLSGRVHLKVQQYKPVAKGQVLYELESPEWHQTQSKLAEMFKACYCCLPELKSAQAAKAENDAEIKAIENRLVKLADAKARDANLELELVKLKSKQPRLEAEINAKKADLLSAQLAYSVLLNEAASLTGIPVDQLDRRIKLEDKDTPAQAKDAITLPTPYWVTIKRIVVHADAAGIVNEIGITPAGWAETGNLVLDTIDPAMLRFHADALQTDIALFEDGQQARIVPPIGGSIPLQDTIDGMIHVGFQAHADQRTIPLYLIPDALPKWAKAGVTAYLEVFLNGNDKRVVAIPKAAVVRDGLDMVFFRRPADDPDHVVRVNAKLGDSDGRWVEVISDLKPGDEVVLDGVYPLVLDSSTSGQFTPGGTACGSGLHQH